MISNEKIYYMHENQRSEVEDRYKAHAIHYWYNIKVSAEAWVRQNSE